MQEGAIWRELGKCWPVEGHAWSWLLRSVLGVSNVLMSWEFLLPFDIAKNGISCKQYVTVYGNLGKACQGWHVARNTVWSRIKILFLKWCYCSSFLRSLQIYSEGLPEFSHVHSPDSLITLLTQGCILGSFWEQGAGKVKATHTPKTGGKGEEPSNAQVQLSGQASKQSPILGDFPLTDEMVRVSE